MKALLAICLMVFATFVWAEEKPATSQSGPGVVQGEVLEVQNVANFTYLRLKTQDGEIWAAVINAPVKQGAKVTIENAIVMKNFESKALKKTFPSIVFGTLSGADGSAASPHGVGMSGDSAMTGSAMTGSAMGSSAMDGSTSGHALGTAYATIPSKKLDTISVEHIPKAKGANAKTVAEIIKNRVALKGKTVVVRGKVVKYNAGIMGKNWIHLRDGSGSAADDSNDILVTSTNETKLNDVVTVKGVVHNDEDFGAGYAYKVLIEDASLQ
ncbi:nucleotide-binding protein [Sideroxydans sp. CL21]|uniref:nucleotide-binding protein n=1 Tax=Sideroxydans sp. CL21 TaxID=2600596 RepID=UPI0012A89296|nr:nucleotide-binding protein [Sideroxydans sp. CL21]VVC83180.1 NrfJ [Sideroxydans sp. CL21]